MVYYSFLTGRPQWVLKLDAGGRSASRWMQFHLKREKNLYVLEYQLKRSKSVSPKVFQYLALH